MAGDLGHFRDIPTNYRIRLLPSLVIDSHVNVTIEVNPFKYEKMTASVNLKTIAGVPQHRAH